MPVCTTTPRVQKLLLACPTSLTDPYTNPSPPAEWFEVVGATRYLVLRVAPSKYTPTRDDNDFGYKDTLAGGFAPVSTARVGFKAIIEDAYLDRLFLVEEIAYASTSTDLRTHTPVEVLDFIRPERGDRKAAAGGVFYTSRRGRILKLEESSGNVVKTNSPSVLLGEGFSITFQEFDRRRLLG